MLLLVVLFVMVVAGDEAMVAEGAKETRQALVKSGKRGKDARASDR